MLKETAKEIKKKLQTGKSLLLIKRLNMLAELRKNGLPGLSKRQLAKTIGVDPMVIVFYSNCHSVAQKHSKFI